MNTKHILVVEDDAKSRDALQQALLNYGHHVRSYASVEDATHHLETGRADIAILDINLPGRWGDDFAKELKKKWPHTQVIFVTGEFDGDMKALKQAHPSSVALKKPVNVYRLLRLVNA